MGALDQQHVPVMLQPVMQLLDCREGGFYVDATVGGGGYATAILEASAPDGRLLGLDWDATALDQAGGRLRHYGQRVILVQANFARLADVLEQHRLGPADGVVVDLGVSSFQLDDPERGFSFVHNGPLDMRMDRNIATNAADLVNGLPEGELYRIIHDLGEERWARRIARAIVSRRVERPFSRTVELAELVSQVVPRGSDTLRIHPATRTFQALRLAVNRELENLQQFLDRVLETLKPGGRLCMVAFHSLEDRMVKRRFKMWSQGCRCEPHLPRCQCGAVPLVRLLTRKVLRPDDAELTANPRARSARLRAVEKVSGN